MTSLSADSPAAPRVPSGVRSFLSNVWGTAKVFIVSLAIVIPVRAYVAQPFFVRGDSMAPTFRDGEYLVIDEFSYRTGLRSLQRGDVVVFRYPLNRAEYYIKRVVGLPGETVRIHEGLVTVVNNEFPRGVLLSESLYLPDSIRTEGTVEVTLKEDEFFTLGDNRSHSSDSRAWGAVTEDLIVGRVLLRVLPLARAGVIHVPWYGHVPTSAGMAAEG